MDSEHDHILGWMGWRSGAHNGDGWHVAHEPCFPTVDFEPEI